MRVYAWSILIRFSLAIALNVFGVNSAFAAAFWGDSGTYDIGGFQLALRWSGEPVSSVYTALAVSGYGWVYFVGAVYSLFGRNQLLVQFLNGLIGSLTMLIIYAIAARLFDRVGGALGGAVHGVLPADGVLVHGHVQGPGDPALHRCFHVRGASPPRASLRGHDRALRRGRARADHAPLLYRVLRGLRRPGDLPVRAAARRGAVARHLRGSRRRPAGALNVAVKRETLERQASYMTLDRLQTTREDQAMWGQSGFGQEYDVSTPTGALAALPTGLVYLLFAPFPWAISGLRQALVLPETLVWYALMPAFVRGLLHAVKHRLRAVLPILVFAASLTAAYALMQGNVGTAYRQRTQITMFFFIFMGVGLAERRRQREARAAVASPSPRGSARP